MVMALDNDIQQMRKQVSQKIAIREAANQAAMKARIAGDWLPLAGSQEFNLYANKVSDDTYYLKQSDSLIRTVKNLSYDSGSSGGWLVPEGDTFEEMYEIGKQSIGGLYLEATVITDGALANTAVAVGSDSGTLGRIVQAAQAATRTDPAFALRKSYQHKFASDEIVAPFELWRDGGPKFFASVVRMAGRRIGRIRGSAFATGSGIGAPYGIFNQIGIGVTCASQTAPTINDLINLKYAVDPSNWAEPDRDPCYIMSASTLKYFKTLLDGNGRPLFETSGLSKERIRIDNFAPSTMTAGQSIAWYGDWKAAVFLHEIDNRLVRYNESFVESDSAAIEAFSSADCFLVDGSAVQALALHS